MSTAILWPILAHIGLVFFLYAWLSYVRVRAVRGREFTINFLACAALAGHLALVALRAV